MKIIRQLITIPLIILRDLLSVIPIYNKLEVMRWICLVYDSSDNALAYISALIAAYGPGDFEQAAIEQMHKHKDARFATALCTAYYTQSEFEKSKQVLQTALEAGCNNEHDLLVIRFYLAGIYDIPALNEIADKIIARKDLGFSASQIAWRYRCWSLTEQGDFVQAAAVADWILKIDECGIALLTKWVTTFKNSPSAAAGYFERARQVWKHQNFEAWAAQGWHFLGKAQNAADYLKRAVEAGFVPHKDDTVFNEIMSSEQYRHG